MDLGYLHRLCKGDRARMAEYILIYLQEAPGLFNHLEAMLDANDPVRLAKAAHGLHPHTHYVGAGRLCHLLITIQGRSGDADATASARDVQECLSLHQDLMQRLRQWTTDGPAANG